MRLKSFNGLLAILLLTSLVVPLLVTTALAKPVGPNPEGVWPSGTVWGTKLHMENLYVRESWFGAGPTAQKTEYFEVMPDYVTVVFIEDSTMYDKIVKLQDTPPQSYSWYVKLFSGGSAPSAGTLSWVLENATHEFIPHDFSIVLDNQAQGILVNLRAQDNHWFSLPTYATLYVDNAVNISISPGYQEGTLGENLTYTVTIKNTGRYADNYSISASDDLGWKLSLDDDSLQVPAGENRTTKLCVLIENCTSDVVKVAADGAYASDSDRAIATVPPHAVKLTVEPGYQDNVPCNWLEYTITVHNVGILPDNYDLGVTDDLGWGDNIYLDNMELENIRPCENKQTTLHVHIPYCVEGGTEDNITIAATSQADNMVSDNNSCLAHVAIVRGVMISISPDNDNGRPCTTLEYTVTITNTGNVDDIYDLSVSDNIGWGDNIWLDNKSLLVGKCGKENMITLYVHIPYCVEGGTEDNITITATSRADLAVSDNASCIAQIAIVRGVEISISPSYQGGLPAGTLDYTVTVKNKGNVSDNYDLSVSDNAGWNLILPDNLLKNVLLCENKQAILSVVIPENADPGTLDNITVTVISRADPLIYNENYCAACVFTGFTLNLPAGWNIVSFPLISEDATPANLFAGMTYTMKYYVVPYGPFREVRPDQPVELGVGYLLKLDNNKTVTVIGIPPENYTMNLVAGWQIVGFPLTSENTTPANLFAGVCYTMKYYVAPYGPFKFMPPDQPVELGVGYLLKLDNSKTITVPL